MLAANVFLLLAFYYLLKTVREALIASEGGAEVKKLRRGGPGAARNGFHSRVGLASRVTASN